MDSAILSPKSINLHKHQNRGRRSMTPTSSLLTSFKHTFLQHHQCHWHVWMMDMQECDLEHFEFRKFSGAVDSGYIGQSSGSSANGMDQINCSSASGTCTSSLVVFQYVGFFWFDSFSTFCLIIQGEPFKLLIKGVKLCQCFGKCDYSNSSCHFNYKW